MVQEFEPAADARPGCLLCREHGGVPLWQDGTWRVIRAEDADFPAFYRVIARHHVGEFSALLAPERQRCMDLVCTVERVLIEQLHPTKINLAALGNMVPHLHWHVIARFEWDSHFPQPVWGPRQREVAGGALVRLGLSLSELDARVAEALAARD
ncbi:HIT family protein [uncultured Piscinibacter sp.]|uniref:HIT family protein n=1 Tax=uncultured Piscinibacter sp. TaxID=1131835 RepID=UPI002611C234|nr:HIT family protein [uncultured Piscinibacter sp.]